MLSWAPLRWWLTMDVFRTITTGSPLGQVRFLNVLVSLAVARNGLLIWPLAGARGALVQRTIKRLHNAASVVWVYHLLCLTGLEQYIASFLMDHLSRKIKSPFMMIGESAFWSLLEQTRHVLVYPFNVVKWLGCLFCGLCLVLLEVAFYISPLVLLAATWIVVYYELYEAFCLSRSLQNGSLCRFSQLRDLVDEYLLEHELDCTHQLLQPTIERLAANTEGGFHADFFLRILQLHSDKMLDIANGCEREVTFSAEGHETLKLEDAKKSVIFMCEAVAPDPSFPAFERRVQGAILDAILEWKEKKNEVEEQKKRV
ncbi:hypothetical protein JCM8547_007745 [Rhodosporidiobolus lusitaniae]